MDQRMEPGWLAPGTRVGEWRVVRRRGGGAYGAVYLAEKVGHPEAGPFALKIGVRPWDPRFEREAELLGRLQHVGVPGLYARGWWTGAGRTPYPYLVLEWVEGVPLYEWGLRQVLTSRQVLRALAQPARALEATHAVEAVHRDVKGDNMLVRPDGTVVLLDFGSGNYRGAPPLTRQQPPPGTPQYQSPEALRHDWREGRYLAQPADDVYALGVTAYRLVTGRYPLGFFNEQEAQAAGRPGQVPRVPAERWVRLSPALAGLIARMLSAHPSDRGNATQLAEALEQAAETEGEEADQPIVPLDDAPVEKREVRVAVRRGWTWRKWRARAVAAAGLLLLIGLGRATRRQPVDWPEEKTPDTDPARLAEAALSARVDKLPSELARSGLSLDLPKEPFPGQLVPPCQKPQLAINGGCWGPIVGMVPPCGANSYEWEKGCYWPLFPTSRRPTSQSP